MTAGGWHPDPTARHQQRWWDGGRWTEHVADGGVTGIDPLDPGGSGLQPGGSGQEAGGGRRRAGAWIALGAGVAAVGVVLAAVLIFVASDDESEGGSSSPECTLVTTAEVAAAVGFEFTDGEPIEEQGTPGCRWESTAPPSGEVSSPLSIEVFRFPLTEEDRRSFDELEGQGANEAIDLGDQAVLRCSIADDISGCDAYGGLFVARGDQYLAVDISNFTFPDDLTQEEARQALLDLAAIAVTRLE